METLHELVFEHRDEIRLAAATSELARAAASAGHGVAVRFLIDGDTSTPPQLVVAVEGAGLAPERRERGGRAMEGLIAAERLVPRCTSREPANAQTVLLGLPLSAEPRTSRREPLRCAPRSPLAMRSRRAPRRRFASRTRISR
jgi:hypothetical protein